MLTNFIISDPAQEVIFGKNYYKGKHFEVRYQKHSRFGFKNIFVPYGPKIKDLEGIKESIAYFDSQRLSKIKIDLPLIISEEIKSEIISKLNNSGYKKAEYIHDNQTILLKPDDIKLDTKDVRYYCRKGDSLCRVEIKNTLNNDEIDRVYTVYLESSKRLKYIPRPKEVFASLRPNFLGAVAYDLENNDVEGFIYGYLSKIPSEGVSTDNSSIILKVLYIGATEKGRQAFVGYTLHKQLIEEAFAKFGVDIVDLYGYSDSIHHRSYNKFKASFGGKIVDLPGSFEKLVLF